jgi:hypothetical protein
MSFATLVIGAVSIGMGIYQQNQANIAAGEARDEAEAAQRELDRQKDAFRDLDTTNPYLNMENVMEDLTINQQQAEFMRTQQMESQANVMQQMRGAAGSSGIAALAQVLANQGALDAQKASASIAEQEAANQLAERTETARIQGLEREGELISRQAEMGKIQSLMGMAADEVSVARSMEMQAEAQRMAAIQQIAEGGMDVAMGTASKIGTNWESGPLVDANQLQQYQQMRGFDTAGQGTSVTYESLAALGLDPQTISLILATKK